MRNQSPHRILQVCRAAPIDVLAPDDARSDVPGNTLALSAQSSHRETKDRTGTCQPLSLSLTHSLSPLTERGSTANLDVSLLLHPGPSSNPAGGRFHQRTDGGPLPRIEGAEMFCLPTGGSTQLSVGATDDLVTLRNPVLLGQIHTYMHMCPGLMLRRPPVCPRI